MSIDKRYPLVDPEEEGISIEYFIRGGDLLRSFRIYGVGVSDGALLEQEYTMELTGFEEDDPPVRFNKRGKMKKGVGLHPLRLNRIGVLNELIEAVGSIDYFGGKLSLRRDPKGSFVYIVSEASLERYRKREQRGLAGKAEPDSPKLQGGRCACEVPLRKLAIVLVNLLDPTARIRLVVICGQCSKPIAK